MKNIIQGDCIEKLKELPESSIDSIVTDPPYELGFMGKSWDKTGIANNIELWKECLRVLKPGGYLLAFSGTRTYHRMASAIEDAGFEVRDMIEWVYGSGFPKSRNIGLDVDKRNGITKNRGKAFVVAGQSGQRDKDTGGDLVPGSNTMGAYVAQNEWSGWGTALKPAHEPICMARKPLAEKTVAENCLKCGTGGINIDESRVGTDKIMIRGGGNITKEGEKTFFPSNEINEERVGRFPANLIHDNSEEVRECFPESKSTLDKSEIKRGTSKSWFTGDNVDRVQRGDSGNASRFFKHINKSTCNNCFDNDHSLCVSSECECGCKDFKSIIYQAKASKRDRGDGNKHPTVKPVALMEYLIKMVTPKNGIVLDPFAGSGSTGVACNNLNLGYILIEKEAEYVEIIKKRLGL